MDQCNNRCEQRCLRRKSKCACHSDYILASDGFSCLRCASVKNGIISPTWHVAICNSSNTSLPLVCSGSLLNDQWVLTSASCVCNEKNSNNLVVKSGKVLTCSISESEETEHSIEDVYCYSTVDSTVLTSDLALIKLNTTRTAKELRSIRPVCLKHGRRTQQVKENDEAVYFGWGNIASPTLNRAVLNKSSGAAVHKRNCKSSFLKEGIKKVENSMFCTVTNSSYFFIP